MADPEEQKKQRALRWQSRLAKGRLGLSDSIEEALADPVAIEEEPEEDEVLAVETGAIQGQSGALVILPRLSLQSKQMPAVRVQPQEEAQTPTQLPKKKRLAGRNTKVELQAIPKMEKKVTRRVVPEKPLEKSPMETSSSNVVLRGHAEVTVQNAQISSSSVVVAVLMSDPGPVVIQYYSLLPGYGFTMHLSAPVTADTQFNYVVFQGEQP